MAQAAQYDAVVVGAGPNGLAAAITLARAGRKVLLREAHPTVGGGSRSAELTLPGFVHDVCSAIHPLGLTSPFLREAQLADFGLEYVQPEAPLAHPLPDGTAVVVERSLEATAASLGRDGPAYRHMLAPFVDNWLKLAPDLLGPLPLPPKHPVLMARFGLYSLWPATWLVKALFRGERAAALMAGMSGHSMMPFGAPLTAGFGVTLAASAHAVGWPLARGGSQTIADALAALLRSLGGEIETGRPVNGLDDLPRARHYLLDVAPTNLAKLARNRLPASYVRRLERYRYGVGAFKLDLALDGPIPWKAPEVGRAATVHLGGTFAEVAEAERRVWRGEHPERPYVLLAQSSLFDRTRAPGDCQTVWAYCHVPRGSTRDMTEPILQQIERFAPGFRDRVMATHARGPLDLEAYNPNYVGGDINNGVQDWRQFYTRPVARRVPYSTPNPSIYLCSSATPPGGGVHGMCGYHAARAVLRAS